MVQHATIIVQNEGVSVDSKLNIEKLRKTDKEKSIFIGEMFKVIWAVGICSRHLILRHHFFDVLYWDIRTDDAQQIRYAHRMVATIIYGRRNGSHKPPPVLVLYAHIIWFTTQENWAPVNWMVGLI